MQVVTDIVKTFIVCILFFSVQSIAFAQEIDVPTPTDVEDEGWTLVPKACLEDTASNFNADGEPLCGFNEMMQLVANIMGLLFVIALALSTLLFAYAGFRYATALGNPSQVQGAKKIFTNVAIGLVLVFGAYLIVTTIVAILGVESDYNQFLEETTGI